MTAKSFFTKSLLATLAAATALGGLSESAFADPGDRQSRGRDERAAAPQRGNWNNSGGGQRDGWQAQSRPQGQNAPAPRWNAQQSPAPSPAPARPERPAQSAWTGGDRGGVNDGDRGNGGQPAWRGRDQNRTNDGRPDNVRNDNRRGDAWRNDNWRNDRNDRDDRARNDNRRNDRNERWRNDNWRNDRDDRWRNDRNDRWRNDNWRNDRNGWRADNDYRRWDNGWRRDNRYNWYSWRNNHREVFRGGYYYAPYRGYSYSRLSIGFYLGAAFFANRYWIDDPWAYRLPPAYGPYRWVRYYDDVLLVDIYSGEVVDVIYDFFW